MNDILIRLKYCYLLLTCKKYILTLQKKDMIYCRLYKPSNNHIIKTIDFIRENIEDDLRGQDAVDEVNQILRS